MQKEKINPKKLKLMIFQILMISLFIFFLVFLFMPKNYELKYSVDDIEITENYDTENKTYYFTFTYHDIKLDFLSENKYLHKRNLINKVEIIEGEENNFCLLPKSDKLKVNPICYEAKEQIHFSLVSKSLKNSLPKEYQLKDNKLIKTYQEINIYDNNHTYLIWNYDGFYYLNQKETKKINIFQKENYNLSLVGYTKDYLVIPDYDANYTFNKFYTIHFDNGTLKEYEVKNNVYFDSYFIGHDKNKLYLVDNKEKTMYELNAKNGDFEKIKSKILKNGKWENISINKLINQKQSFKYDYYYEYEQVDNNLYLNYQEKDLKTLIAKDVTRVIKETSKEVIYLKQDELYAFTPQEGETKLLQYFEWNFNNDEVIFIR